MSTRRIGILISGRGSNMAALIAAARANALPADIAAVVSNRADAPGLATAAHAGIATGVIEHGRYATREAFEDALTAVLERHAVDLVCSAGFMRLLTATFVDRWHGRHLNIHPSLLPAFRGLHTHARVLKAGIRITGATVHEVRLAMDDGPVVAQCAVPVLLSDTVDSLAARVLAAEHVLYPHAVRLFLGTPCGAAEDSGDRLLWPPLQNR